ncbi:hypothetical protein [Arhodomonas sp. AD133]|uniref:hypothetical protein n=1 Tax=Arhodomonas sp. AD133 TaxID=3415009 RepID=UPI003EBE8003
MGRRLLLTALVLAGVLAVAAYRPRDPWDAPTGPRPWLTADDVVTLQLEALRRNGELRNDRGIRIALRFASPSTREHLGADTFAARLRQPYFRAILQHRSASIVARAERDGRAAFRVRLDRRNKAEAPTVFLFLLSRRYLPDCNGCWVTDLVHPWPTGVQRRTGIDV